MGCLYCPRAGAGIMRVVAVLETGAPAVGASGCPVVAVGGVLADNGPEAGLAARQRAGDLEAMKRDRWCCLRGLHQV